MKLIPTARKEKLPPAFSYPVGAQTFSEALEGTPQAGKAELWFDVRDEAEAASWRDRVNARGTVALLRVEFSTFAGRWWFRLCSVPTPYAAAARDHLLAELRAVRAELIKAGTKDKSYRREVLFNLAEAPAA